MRTDRLRPQRHTAVASEHTTPTSVTPSTGGSAPVASSTAPMVQPHAQYLLASLNLQRLAGGRASGAPHPHSAMPPGEPPCDCVYDDPICQPNSPCDVVCDSVIPGSAPEKKSDVIVV